MNSINIQQKKMRGFVRIAHPINYQKVVFCSSLLKEGIYVIGFFYPVVPKDLARIRVQISAGHDREHLDKAIAAFTKVGTELEVINKK